MPHMIHRAAEIILNAAITPPLMPQFLGRDWVSRWLKQHPNLHKTKQKAKDSDRIDAQKIGDISQWFAALRGVMYDRRISHAICAILTRLASV